MDIFEVTVDLFKCLSRGFFIRFMKDAFSFPSYFGENLDAIDECMEDLSWIQEKKIRVKLINYNKALKTNESAASKLITMFRKYELFWENEGLSKDRKEFMLVIVPSR